MEAIVRIDIEKVPEVKEMVGKLVEEVRQLKAIINHICECPHFMRMVGCCPVEDELSGFLACDYCQELVKCNQTGEAFLREVKNGVSQEGEDTPGN